MQPLRGTEPPGRTCFGGTSTAILQPTSIACNSVVFAIRVAVGCRVRPSGYLRRRNRRDELATSPRARAGCWGTGAEGGSEEGGAAEYRRLVGVRGVHRRWADSQRRRAG